MRIFIAIITISFVSCMPEQIKPIKQQVEITTLYFRKVTVITVYKEDSIYPVYPEVPSTSFKFTAANGQFIYNKYNLQFSGKVNKRGDVQQVTNLKIIWHNKRELDKHGKYALAGLQRNLPNALNIPRKTWVDFAIQDDESVRYQVYCGVPPHESWKRL